MFKVIVQESVVISQACNLKQLMSTIENLYPQWHPYHKKFEFLTKTPSMKGSTFRFDEVIEGIPLSVKGVIIACSENEVVWRSISRIIDIGGSIQKVGEKILQTVYYSLPVPLYFVARLLKRFVNKEQLAKHVKEELQNMKAIIEISKHD